MGVGSVILNQPGVLLYDADGNPIATTDDGGEHKLEAITKQRNAAGTIIDPATQGTLEAIKDTDGVRKIVDPLPAGTNVLGKLGIDSANTGGLALESTQTTLATEASVSSIDGKVATEATLSSLEGKAATQTTLAALETKAATQTTLAALESKAATQTTLATLATQVTAAAVQAVLEAIRDTAGVKKITDELPAGTQDIGSFRLRDILGNGISSVLNNTIRRLEARASITSPDGSLDVAVVTDNSINRVESRNTIVGQVGGTGSEAKVTTIADTEEAGEHRLQTESRLAPGSSVNIGSSIPSDPANLVIEFLKEPGGSESMLVNGGGTAVNFTYAPAAGESISVSDVLVVFTADDFTFDGGSFGPNAPLTNGVLFQIYADGATTDLFIIHQNEDFLRIPGRIPVINNTGPKDLLSAAFAFGGLIKLHGDDGDYVRMIVRDNLTSTKFKYFTATLYGAEI